MHRSMPISTISITGFRTGTEPPTDGSIWITEIMRMRTWKLTDYAKVSPSPERLWKRRTAEGGEDQNSTSIYDDSEERMI